MDISSINAEARALVDATTSSYPASDLLRRVNAAYEEVVGFILGIDGKWQFDDTNYTDFPIGTTTLVAAQKDYTFDSTHLEIERVEVLGSSGVWYQLKPIDISEINDAIAEFEKNDGLPEFYDKNGSSIVLYPAPATGSVTMAAGLKVYFKRTADVFTTAQVTTGTKKPGFASPYHVILAYKAALPYAQSYKKDRVPFLINEIKRLEDGLLKHYGRRELDRKKVMSMRGISYR